MTELITRTGAWLLQQAATLPDTVVMKTVAVERGWFETVTGIASGVMTLTLLGLAIVLAPAAWSFWRTFKRVREMLDRVETVVAPVSRHASSIADNVDYITTSIRQDVQQVKGTIASANRRLEAAVEATEQRLNEFNALLEVVQQEAEQAFISTAATVRGVKTGAAAFAGVDGGAADARIQGGSDDGNDDESETARGRDAGPQQAPARPRVRSRRKRRE